jgi:hypothetical protein
LEKVINKINLGTVLVSLLFGVISAVLAYKYLDTPLTYTDFIAGSITWGGEGKSKDVSLVFVFIAVTTLSLIGLGKYQSWIIEKYDDLIVKSFNTTLMYVSIPFVMWIGEQFLSKSVPNYDLLYFNAWIIFGGIIAAYLILNSINKVSNHKINELIIFSFVVFTFITLSTDVLGAILIRFGKGEGLSRTLLMNGWNYLPLLWLIILYFTKNKIKYYKYSLFAVQITLIGYFIFLLPSPYRTEGVLTFFPVKNLLYVVVFLIITYSVYDIYKRFKLNKNDSSLSFSLLSPFPIAALFILMFLSGTALPNVNADDYHYGEKLLPFYMISKYHIIPYADYALAHGFVDMFPAIGSTLFLDGTASTLHEGNRILTAIVVVFSFLAVYRYVGLLVATILTILILPIGIWYFIAVVMSLVLFYVKVERLGISFFLVSLIVFLLAPGQGAIFIVAILPLILYRAWKSKTLISNLKFGGISFAVLIILSLLMPWIFEMIFSAVRYVLENGPINFQAYGVAWHLSWNSARTINSSLAVYEVIRTSWIFVPMFIVSFWLLGFYKNKKEAFFYALFMTIFVLIMHKYALGRIDPFGLSRIGIVSRIAIPLLFLSVYFLHFSKIKFAHWTLLFIFWIGLLTPNYWHNPINNAKRGISEIGKLTNGNEIGIKNLGNGRTNAKHISRLLEIKKITDKFLDDNETFVNVTNRGGLYFYLDKRMPVEAVPYNQAHQNMQKRSVDRLSKNPPPMALLKADNINHDGRSVSIRTHRLYRWIIENYVPVAIDNIIIGVHKDKINRFNSRFTEIKLAQSNEEEMLLWDKIFLLQDLQQLPISWGSSKKTLDKNMIKNKEVKFTAKGFNNTKAIDNESYKVLGSDPFIVYDISKYNLAGKDAGLLSFDFTCDNKNAKPKLELYWSADDYGITEKTVVRFNVHNGHAIVPLDAMPRWMNARHIKNVRIDLQNQTDCKVFSIKNLNLNQRVLNAE